ncbi:MAG TPA: DUF805 domain-containing protein [Sphingomicrobium sp.]|nr:DUF805 domain-containing protein [Sphingomicrobium sp.]
MFEAFNNYSDFSGRARRSEYWLFQLLNLIIIVIGAAMIGVGAGGLSVAQYAQSGNFGGSFMIGVGLLVFWGLIAFVPNLAVTVRRFHDHNVSGWWAIGLYVLSVIPYIGLLASLAMLWVLVRAGTFGPNNYGPDSVNPWRSNASFA